MAVNHLDVIARGDATAITGRVRRMVRMEAMARASSTEAFDDVLATIVRADEVVAMDREGRPVG